MQHHPTSIRPPWHRLPGMLWAGLIIMAWWLLLMSVSARGFAPACS
jgi:hypothetical protein